MKPTPNPSWTVTSPLTLHWLGLFFSPLCVCFSLWTTSSNVITSLHSLHVFFSSKADRKNKQPKTFVKLKLHFLPLQRRKKHFFAICFFSRQKKKPQRECLSSWPSVPNLFECATRPRERWPYSFCYVNLFHLGIKWSSRHRKVESIVVSSPKCLIVFIYLSCFSKYRWY